MKTIFSSLLLICITHLSAQEFLNDHPFLFGGSAGISIINLSNISVSENGKTTVADKTSNFPVIGGFFEFRLNRKIGIGLECTYGYNRWDMTYGTFPNFTHETYTYTRIRILPHLNLYYLDKNSGFLRHYLFSSFGIGYKNADFDVISNNQFVQEAYSYSSGIYESPIAFKTSIAYGIDVKDFWFTKIEFAIGGPFLNLGTGIRF